MEDLLKRIAIGIGIEFGMDVLCGYVLSRLEGVSPLQLYHAIRNGSNVNAYLTDQDRIMGYSYVYRYRDYLSYLTADRVLDWLRRRRTDLASVIINVPGGVEWLSKQVELLKDELLNPPGLPRIKLVPVKAAIKA